MAQSSSFFFSWYTVLCFILRFGPVLFSFEDEDVIRTSRGGGEGGGSLKRTLPAELSNSTNHLSPHSQSMDLSLGQALPALGQCRYYRACNIALSLQLTFHQPSQCCTFISRHLLFPQPGPFSHTFFVDLLIIIKPLRTVREGKYHTCVCSRPGETPPVLCLNQSLLKMTWYCCPLWRLTVLVFLLVPVLSGENQTGNVSSWIQEQNWHLPVEQGRLGRAWALNTETIWASWGTLFWLVCSLGGNFYP